MRRFVVAAAVAKAAVVIVAVATDPCGPLRRSWREAFRPVRTSARSLIIGAGEGSAGSRTLIQWIANATFPPTTVGHWLRTYPPQSTAGPAYRRAVRAIAALRPQDHASFDYTVFDHATAVGAILDTPVPQFFPYIFQSYPNARVILAVRNASDWVRRRRRDPRLNRSAGVRDGAAAASRGSPERRGAAAAASWIVRASRRRRGRELDRPSVAAPPRPRAASFAIEPRRPASQARSTKSARCAPLRSWTSRS